MDEGGCVVDVTTITGLLGLFDVLVHPAVIAERMSMTATKTVTSTRFIKKFPAVLKFEDLNIYICLFDLTQFTVKNTE